MFWICTENSDPFNESSRVEPENGENMENERAFVGYLHFGEKHIFQQHMKLPSVSVFISEFYLHTPHYTTSRSNLASCALRLF